MGLVELPAIALIGLLGVIVTMAATLVWLESAFRLRDLERNRLAKE